MRKILVLTLGVVLLAAACNKSSAPVVENTPSPSQTPAPTPTPAPTEAPDPAPVPAPVPAPTPTPVSAKVEIKMTASGFESSSVTVKKGTKVTFANNDSKSWWPASAPHPTHTDYPEFDAKKAIEAGQSWSFTFEQVGTWKFHDHLNPTKFGSVIVTE